jgi:hypothetical protein
MRIQQLAQTHHGTFDHRPATQLVTLNYILNIAHYGLTTDSEPIAYPRIARCAQHSRILLRLCLSIQQEVCQLRGEHPQAPLSIKVSRKS